ncbi:unnamed protein product [Soboliphyme baturini]|uniref:ARID domain-containing protein n=1 Tax=Soboliphyme baturini TaxID=241478 RepID=A0A183IWC4_9BILA|nr:unnamed protein product [Soboliphyme baturini]
MMTTAAEKHEEHQFLIELTNYFRRRNVMVSPPTISGRRIDLFRLYKKVTSLGGSAKVSNKNQWKEVLSTLNIPRDCLGADHAVRMIYMRYLSRFEQKRLFGTDSDDEDAGGMIDGNSRSSRGRHHINSLHAAAMRSHHHFLPPATGTGPLHTARDAAIRLRQSFVSGLPNEVDFAVNICTLLSNSSSSISKSFVAPSLFEVMLAHIGLFEEDSSYRTLYTDCWSKYVDRRFMKYWFCSIDDPEIRDLIGPSELPVSCVDSSISTEEKRMFNVMPNPTYDRVVHERIVQVSFRWELFMNSD